jgi:hypothetical protein
VFDLAAFASLPVRSRVAIARRRLFCDSGDGNRLSHIEIPAIDPQRLPLELPPARMRLSQIIGVLTCSLKM